jgi:hypothetical protein
VLQANDQLEHLVASSLLHRKHHAMALKQFLNICICRSCAQCCVAKKSHFRRQPFPGHHFLACSFAIMWFPCSAVEVGATQMHVNLPKFQHARSNYVVMPFLSPAEPIRPSMAISSVTQKMVREIYEA